MIAEYIENALVIDDKEGEVDTLIQTLRGKGVAVTYFDPSQEKRKIKFRNHKIVFLDLYLNPSTTQLSTQISTIRSILKDNFGPLYGAYGIVLWSAHSEYLEKLQKSIQKDAEKNYYTLPLFMISLDKTKYSQDDSKIKTLYDDIDNALKEDFAARFFMEWYNSVRIAQDKTIYNIYSLLPDYSLRSKLFMFVLGKMAVNYNGISKEQVNGYPLYIDAFKSFDDILHGELVGCQKSSSNVFENCPKEIYEVEVFNEKTDIFEQQELTPIFAHLNAANFIDDNNIDLKKVVPGNVYEVMDPKCELYIKSDDWIYKSLSGIGNKRTVKRVVLEITPPCDFANTGKSIRARLIGGLIIIKNENTKDLIKRIKERREFYYNEVYPVKIPNNKGLYHIVFDYRYLGAESKDKLQVIEKYKVLFRLKPRLFADILQKFSSHAARLGVSVFH